jgi:5-hydroxyisourate hydrolase-like protein (transthyretin family)
MRLAVLWTAFLVLVFLTDLPAQQASGTRLAGTVQDISSAGIDKVALRLQSLDRVFQTRSGPDGSFGFDQVPAGVYDLYISAPGLVKQKLKVDLEEPATFQPLRIVLQIGSFPDAETCGTIPLVNYGPIADGHPSLSGEVKDAISGKPVANAKIAVFSSGKKQVVQEAKSDKKGRFTVQNLAAGYYDVRISYPRYWPEDIKDLLMPRENVVSVDVTILQRDRIFICQ